MNGRRKREHVSAAKHKKELRNSAARTRPVLLEFPAIAVHSDWSDHLESRRDSTNYFPAQKSVFLRSSAPHRCGSE
jgi:hypothetical protein